MTSLVWTDVAPRDGLQNVDGEVTTPAKIALVRGLLDAGVPRVEATSFVSPTWVPQLADADAVITGLRDDERSHVRVLIPNRRGLERALEHGLRNVLLTIAVTDAFNKRNVNRTVAESLDDLDDIVSTAAAAECTIDVAVSVSFGCPFEGRVEPERVIKLCEELVKRGVDEVGLADTIGVADPASVTALCGQARGVVPVERLSLHVHDTRGLGVANVVAAYEAGVRRFDGSVGGVGGCPFAPRSTGNVCSEDALLALDALGAGSGIDLAAMCAVADALSSQLGRELPGKLHRAGVWTGVPSLTEERVG